MNAAPASKPFRPGIWVPIVTPFSHGEIDHGAAANLVRGLCRSGVHGLVACGTTGEGPALSAYEKARFLDTVFTAAAGDLPIVLALEGSNTAKMIAERREIGQWPVTGHLLPAPAYVRPSEEGLHRHFMTIAEACDTPVMLYDIPARTGVTLRTEFIAKLAASGCFPAIKACGLSARRLKDLIDIPGLSVFCGDDAWSLSALKLGVEGVVGASANVVPEAFVALYEAVRHDRGGASEAIWSHLLPLTELLFDEPNPAPVKAALALRGVLEDGLRLPLTPCSQGLRERLQVQLSLGLADADAHLHLPDKSYK